MCYAAVQDPSLRRSCFLLNSGRVNGSLFISGDGHLLSSMQRFPGERLSSLNYYFSGNFMNHRERHLFAWKLLAESYSHLLVSKPFPRLTKSTSLEHDCLFTYSAPFFSKGLHQQTLTRSYLWGVPVSIKAMETLTAQRAKPSENSTRAVPAETGGLPGSGSRLSRSHMWTLRKKNE